MDLYSPTTEHTYTSRSKRLPPLIRVDLDVMVMAKLSIAAYCTHHSGVIDTWPGSAATNTRARVCAYSQRRVALQFQFEKSIF